MALPIYKKQYNVATLVKKHLTLVYIFLHKRAIGSIDYIYTGDAQKKKKSIFSEINKPVKRNLCTPSGLSDS